MTTRLAATRALIGTYATVWLVVRTPHHLGLRDLPDHRWQPVGALAPLDAPPPSSLVVAVVIAAIAAAAAFALGRRRRVTAPLAAVLTLLVTTYASSWGQLFHTENLLVLHLVVLAVAALPRRPMDAEVVLRALASVTAATYVVSGIAKLRNSGWAWLDGEALRDQVAFDNLRKAVIGGATSPIASTLVEHAWVFAPMAVAALAVELGAPLALTRPRVAAAWIAAAWLFHVGVLALMAIGFPYQLSGVAFAPLLPVERLRLHSLRSRWSVSPSPLPSSPSP